MKTIKPTMALPPITKLPKASITSPASPFNRIYLVVVMLSAILKIVVISKSEGNTEKSSASLLNIAINNIRSDNDMFILSIISTRNSGIGIIIIRIINIIPTDTTISPIFIIYLLSVLLSVFNEKM